MLYTEQQIKEIYESTFEERLRELVKEHNLDIDIEQIINEFHYEAEAKIENKLFGQYAGY